MFSIIVRCSLLVSYVNIMMQFTSRVILCWCTCCINLFKFISVINCIFICQEPMYLILNTAISHRWGFPEPCPADQCSACWHCFDCTNPGSPCLLVNSLYFTVLHMKWDGTCFLKNDFVMLSKCFVFLINYSLLIIRESNLFEIYLC